MLSKSLAAGLLALVPGFAAAETLPPSYDECRSAEDPAAGVAACEEALQSPALLQAERARAYVTLSTYQREMGAFPAALASLEEAARIAPNAPIIPVERAIVLHLSGDLAGASEAHARVFALGPGTAATFNNRGVTKLASGDAAAAIADFDSALAMMPDNEIVLANRATAKCKAGDAEGSVADRLAALEIGDTDLGELEAAMAAAGFEGGLGTATDRSPSALAEWTSAGCPGAAAPKFL